MLNKIKQKLFLIKVQRIKGLVLNGVVHFRLKPLVKIVEHASIKIGANVLINSDLDNYHLNLYAKCKLIADKEGATIEIGKNTRIHGSCIHAFDSIKIGDNCLVAGNVQIFDCNAHDLSFENPTNRIHTTGKTKPVIIEDNVWLGTNVIVLPGVTIGSGTVISANSVVNKDIPSMVLAGGNPAKIIKDFKI